MEDYINDLQAQYFKYNNNNTWVQLAVRPIQLWELAFPKTALKEVLNTVMPIGVKELKFNDFRQKYATALRLMLKAKKVPEMDISNVQSIRLIRKDNLAIMPIGIREDKVWDHGDLKGEESL